MFIEYIVRNVYGNELAYPANSWAELVCDIAGTKTLAPWLLARLDDAGIECEKVHD
jgi:hypothetical protein